MQNISFAGVIVAVIAVFLAYYMGFANGVVVGRDEGFHDGRRDGKREGSIRAYAVGFDRGKRARDGDEEEEDDEDEEGVNEGGVSRNLGVAILVVAAGLFAVLWLSSNTPTIPQGLRDATTQFPVMHADESDQYGDAYLPTARTLRETTPPRSHAQFKETPATLPRAVVLPKVNRFLPTTPLGPSQAASSPDDTSSETERGPGGFPHPPPAFSEP